MRRMPLFMGLLSFIDKGEPISLVHPARHNSHSTPPSPLLLFSENSHLRQDDNQRCVGKQDSIDAGDQPLGHAAIEEVIR